MLTLYLELLSTLFASLSFVESASLLHSSEPATSDARIPASSVPDCRIQTC